MSAIVLDTNVISEPRLPRPAPAVVGWLEMQDPDDLFLTATVLGELAVGVAILPAGRRRDAFEQWLAELVQERFAGRVLAYDARAALLYGELSATARAQGRTSDVADAQIAAVAKLHGMAVATRNVADFEPFGVAVVNPWAG